MQEAIPKTVPTNINSLMKQFITDHFPSARKRALQDTDPLIENGIIDSLGILDVVAFMESEFRLSVEDDELVPENFQTIARITAYVEKKLNSTP